MLNEKYTGYLFCFFTGKEEHPTDEQIYFAVSRDGLHWKDLNEGCPILLSDIGEKGVRDPFILRMEQEEKYVIMATDLKIQNGYDWEHAAQNGSKKIVFWESKDLINWSHPYFFDTGLTQAGSVWAPEAIYDEEQNAYMIYWSSNTADAKTADSDGQKKYRIYRSYTKDFHAFSEPELYMEKSVDIIDTTMIRVHGNWYRFTKNEGTQKIMMEKGTHIEDSCFTSVPSAVLDQLSGIEGPIIYQLPGQEKWCLLVDRYKENGGYTPLLTTDLESGEFIRPDPQEYDNGSIKKRHGSVMYLTEEEWKRLTEKW